MESNITYAEINEWASSFEKRDYSYRKIHPTYKVVGISINKHGEKTLFVNRPDYDWKVYTLGRFNGHNSKELFTKFVHGMKELGYWEGNKYLNYGEYFKDYGLPVEAKKVSRPRKEGSVKPKKVESKTFSTPVEAKPSPDNSDVPHFKTVVAHNYKENKPQIETIKPEHKEASNVREVKAGKPFIISLLEYFFKK